MIFLDDMKDYIDSLGTKVAVYEVNMPPEPDNCLVLEEYGGLPPEQGQTSTYGLQLVLRCKPEDYAEYYEKMYTINEALAEVGFEDGSMPEGLLINGHLYLRIYMQGSGIIPLGEDANGRVLLYKNFYVVKGETE